MERILIIGCSCSGKSTLARAMGEKTGLPVIHLDQLWWREGWVNVTREEFDRQLEAVLSRNQWIIDGNYSRTMDQRIARCDSLIYLNFSRWACLRGMLQRVLGRYGTVRPDMSPGCPERFHWELVKWIWNYNRDNQVRNELHMAKARHAKITVLKSRKEVQAFLAAL